MSETKKHSTKLNLALWATQIILSGSLVWAGYMKLFHPADQLALMWPWTADHPTLVTVTALFDLLAALGLILPTALNIMPKLAAIAAIGCIALMIAAAFLHIARGEASLIGINLFYAVLSAFVAWGRITSVH